jgi:hypothetical protein
MIKQSERAEACSMSSNKSNSYLFFCYYVFLQDGYREKKYEQEEHPPPIASACFMD